MQEALTAALEERQLRALPVVLGATPAVRRERHDGAPALGQRGRLDDRVPAEGQHRPLVHDDLDLRDLAGVGAGGEVARLQPVCEVTEGRALATLEERRIAAQRTPAGRLQQLDSRAELAQQPAGEAAGGRLGDQPRAEAVERKHGRPFVPGHREDARGWPPLRDRRRGRRRSSRPRAAPPRCPRRAVGRGLGWPSVSPRAR